MLSSMDFDNLIGGETRCSLRAHCPCCRVSVRLSTLLMYTVPCCASAGPLNAIVAAQSKAAMSTVDFIYQVGFDAEGKSRNIDFTYNTTNPTTGLRSATTLSVPILTTIPIPVLRVRASFWLVPPARPPLIPYSKPDHRGYVRVQREAVQCSGAHHKHELDVAWRRGWHSSF
jgi:Protein of unknown function (DUF2589)